ncbi:hypothetical protein [Magnetospirillum sp. XM-1]|uniref:hypothetical protein n=1 Tax=Magnetospirillum sp. XM-1 TaxID=1663591 RepID=UPI0012E3F413|nr:hypothetical protein [Magnetospirillum sp. XM-1]
MLTAPPGSLQTLSNAHITRGGEIEKRKAFVGKYTLPAGTFGMAAANSKLYVFGSATAPAVPTGVTYQRLQHPDGLTMSRVVDAEVFNGKLYVLAEYSDGSVFHFYDGALVTDWGAGIVRSAMTNNDGIAEHLRALIDADADYTATRVGSVVTVTGPVGTTYAVSTTATNGGATDNQALTAATTQVAISGISETRASGTVTITGGTANTAATGTVTLTGGASGSVSSITVNGVEVLGATVNYNASLTQTATDIATQINSYTSSPEYTAAAVGAVVTISAAQSVGADANGFVVAATASTITTSTANMASGVTNAITSIKVDGIEVLGSRVNWSISNSAMATNVASTVTSYSSSPDYDATASSSSVTIKAAAGAGAGANGKVITVTTSGSVTVTGSGNALAGGVSAVTGQSQISTLTVGGTFEVDDRFSVTLGDKTFGAATRPSGKATSVKTIKSKVYATAASLMPFCALNDPTKWSSNETGAGVINMANQDAGSEELVGMEIYYNRVAIFSRGSIQLWQLDADPNQNTQIQVVRNNGAVAGGAIMQFGDADVFYLSASGLRSLRARDASNAAAVSDVGTPVDKLLIEHMLSLGATNTAKARAIVEPVTGRFWLALGNLIYVFSYFSGSKIAAWSTYDPGFTPDEMVVLGNRIYVRAADEIYLYGGDDEVTYDNCTVTVELPMLDGQAPATSKTVAGIDVACSNTWSVYVGTDPLHPTVRDLVGTVTQTTYSLGQVAAVGEGTHIGLKLVCASAGAATLSNVIVHYTSVGSG